MTNIHKAQRITKAAVSPTVLAVGYRGTAFIVRLVAAGLRPVRVVSYRQAGDRSEAFERLSHLCHTENIPFEVSRRPVLDGDQLVFLVGWQFLLKNNLEKCVVFHDLILPDLRGFSPTVTALLRGDKVIGVTALRPTAGTDAGPIFGTRTVRVPPGVSLQTAFDLQTDAMVELAVELANRFHSGNIDSVPQDENVGTFSLWRDSFDYFIDWRRNAEEIVRQVTVLGYPYDGAKGQLTDHLLTITKAQLGPNIDFAIRDPGKVWQIKNDRALVVCGAGTVWIDEALDADAQPYRFKALRTRFLTADTAWLARRSFQSHGALENGRNAVVRRSAPRRSDHTKS